MNKKFQGYDFVSPKTTTGKILTVAYGLIGIPLMFITAVNIGKLFSEWTSWAASRLRSSEFSKKFSERISKKFFGTKTSPEKKEEISDPFEKLQNQIAPKIVEVPTSFIIFVLLGVCGLGSIIFCRKLKISKKKMKKF